MVVRCLLAACLLILVIDARVSFMYTEVLQQTDVPDFGDKAPFKCDTGCQVYTDSKSSSIYITKFNDKTGIYEAVTTFANMGGSNKQRRVPYALKASDKYFVDNRGDLNPFVFYVVDNQAPNLATPVYEITDDTLDLHYKRTNLGTPVYVITDDAGLTIQGTDRVITVLNSKTPAVTWTKFEGARVSNIFGVFPKIYSSGFDNVDVDYCEPVFYGASVDNLKNLSVTVPTPISSINFGSSASHTISVCWNKNAAIEHVLTTAYVTPGFHGCAFNTDELYSTTLNASIHDSFTFAAKSAVFHGYINLPTVYDALNVQINDKKYSFRGSALTPQCFFGDSYNVTLDWTGRSKGASFAVMVDFNADCPF